MTTTEPAVDPVETDAVDTDAVDAQPEPELCWLNLGDLAPHPDNPRRSLGDLTEGSGFHQMRATRRVLIRR